MTTRIPLILMSFMAVLIAACGGGGGGAAKQQPTTASSTELQTAGQQNPNTQVITAPSAPTYNWPEPARIASLTSAAVLQKGTSGFTCSTGAISCVEVVSTSTQAQASAPVTFGQPFRAGEVPADRYLAAQDNLGETVPVQLDATTTREDGSLRFGVVTAWVSNLQAGERRIVNLFLTTTPPPLAAKPDVTNYDLVVEARTYQPQSTMVLFGDRAGHTDGAPFLQGETIKMVLDGPAREEFNLTVNAEQAGGGFVTLTRIATAFLNLINNSTNSRYTADNKNGTQYEKLWITTKDPSAGAFSVRFEYSGAGKFTVSDVSTFGPARTWTAIANNALRSAVQNDTNMHLRGHVANEYTVVQRFKDAGGNIHPQLTARFHTRLLDGGQRARTDLVIENNWAYDPNPGNQTYSLIARSHGVELLNQPTFTHHHHARWHKVLWQGAEVKAQVRHHMPYFMHSKVVWNYDLSLDVPDSVLQREADRLAGLPKDPMSGMLISKYFPMTGGREEIGPYPRWTALFLVTQDDAARASMMANATAAGVVPIHYRDSQTDQPLSIDDYPQAATLNGTSPYSPNVFPAMADGATDWTPDVAHQGSFAFVPYLVTGDVFYLDEVMFWAAWNLASQNPGYREGSKGLLHPDQVRAQAWGLRSVGEAARIAPDNHPMKAYFETKLDNNLSWYLSTYNTTNAMAGLVSPLGAVNLPDSNLATIVWQNDFLAIVMSQLANDGYKKAEDYLKWLAKFSVGRFLQEPYAGLCLSHAPSKDYVIRLQGSAPAQTWSQLVALQSWAGTDCSTSELVMEAFPDSAYGYAAVARAMLGATANAGITDALQAYTIWESKVYAPTKRSAQQIFSADPTWAIVPAN